ncbi:MAG TPA: hypothetical protein VMA95_01715 [Streptosporangiaceae bacterium]|nr:hypothetical protein [Streptosporangiaceae bacterium]
MGKMVTGCVGLVLAAVLAGCAQPAAGQEAGSSWGKVIEVPGLGALVRGNGGGAEVGALSCASAGNCAAGGYYWDHGEQAFVAVEKNGRWGQAAEVPGMAALNQGRYASVYAMSCTSAGTCTAGGEDAPEAYGQDFDGFVTVEKNGVWSRAITLPSEDDGSVDSVYCVSAGDCLAGGTEAEDYFDTFHGFLAQERDGRWGKPFAVPGLATLAKGDGGDVTAMCCSSAGNCSGGGYTDGGGGYPEQAFVISQHDGKWDQATRVPDLAALNKGDNAQVNSVSCVSAGNCVAGGYYSEKGGRLQGFVAVERNGTWGKATGVPGLAALSKDTRPTTVWSVSCTPAGSCAAGGFYTGRSRRQQGFVISERNGHWGTPRPLPGLATLNTDGAAQVSAVWCAHSGPCAAGGFYADRSRHSQGFVTQGG